MSRSRHLFRRPAPRVVLSCWSYSADVLMDDVSSTSWRNAVLFQFLNSVTIAQTRSTVELPIPSAIKWATGTSVNVLPDTKMSVGNVNSKVILIYVSLFICRITLKKLLSSFRHLIRRSLREECWMQSRLFRVQCKEMYLLDRIHQVWWPEVHTTW